MKNPNGYGCVRKLSGKRRNPYGVYVTTNCLALAKRDISFLKDALPKDLYARVEKEYNSYIESHPVAKQTQKCIGYYPTRQAAMIALAEYNKSPYDIDAANITFSDVWEILVKESIDKMNPSSRQSHMAAYKKCATLHDIKMTDIRKTHLQSVLDSCSDYSQSTQSNIAMVMHKIFDYCLENDILKRDYSQYISLSSTQLKKTKSPFTKEEILLVRNNQDIIGSGSLDVNLSDTVLIMIYTGLRISELLKLKGEDIDLDKRILHVHGTKTEAGDRLVPIHQCLVPIFANRKRDGYIFLTRNGDSVTPQIYRRYFWEIYCQLTGLSHTPHECRHTFASLCAMHSLNPIHVKKIMGHKAMDITQDVYTHIYMEELVKEIDKIIV